MNRFRRVGMISLGAMFAFGWFISPTRQAAAQSEKLIEEQTKARQEERAKAAIRHEQLEDLKRGQESGQAQQQLNDLKNRRTDPLQPQHPQAAKTQIELDQKRNDQQLQRLQTDEQIRSIQRETDPLRQKQQIDSLQRQQQIDSLKDQIRRNQHQQDLDRLRHQEYNSPPTR